MLENEERIKELLDELEAHLTCPKELVRDRTTASVTQPPDLLAAAMRLSLGILILVCLASLAFAADCIDYSQALHIESVLDSEGHVSGVQCAGSYAVLTDNTKLRVIDISNPALPIRAGGLDLYVYLYGLTLMDSFALVAGSHPIHGYSLRVLDVSDPIEPTLVGGTPIPAGGSRVAEDGGTAWIACHEAGITAVDVSDPSNPIVLVAFETIGRARGLDVVSTTLFVAASDSGLAIYDVSTPTTPSLLASLDLGGYAMEVIVSGPHAWVSDSDGSVMCVDVSDPANPIVVSQIRVPGSPMSSTVEEDLLWVSASSAGLVAVDISDVASPEVVGRVNTNGAAWGASVSGDFVYVADGWAGMCVVDASTSRSPGFVTQVAIPTNRDTSGISTWSQYAAVSTHGDGLYIVDIASPATATVVGAVDSPWVLGKSAAAGDYLAVTKGMDGLLFVDVSTPSAPVVTTTLGTRNRARAVALDWPFGYVANSGGGLFTFDARNPQSPLRTSIEPTIGSAIDVTLLGENVIVSCGRSGIQVFDLTSPRHPTPLSSLPLPGTAMGASTLADRYLLVGGEDAGVHVVDMSIPESPELVTTFDTPGTALDVEVAGNVAYVSDGSEGILVLDVADPTLPVVIGHQDATGDVESAALTAIGVCVSGPEGQLDILPRQCGEAVSAPASPGRVGRDAWLGPAYPNPFNPQTTLSYSLPASGRVELVVYDLAGRRVKTLVSGHVEAGQHDAQWDARDEQGRRVASGVYLYRLVAGEFSETKRMVLLK